MIFWYSFVSVIVAGPCVWWQIPVLSFLLAEKFEEACDEILLTLNSLGSLCVCSAHTQRQWESLTCCSSLCPSLSCWATARSRWTCRCSLAQPTIAICGPTPSTRCTASPARPWPPPARRSSLPAPKCWKFLCFLKTTCQPGTSQQELAIGLLWVVFIFFVSAKVKEKSCKISIFSTNLGHDEETSLKASQCENSQNSKSREAGKLSYRCVLWLRLRVSYE